MNFRTIVIPFGILGLSYITIYLGLGTADPQTAFGGSLPSGCSCRS